MKKQMRFKTDFGLATFQRDPHDEVMSHKPAGSPRISLVGTCRYASVNGHLNVAPSRGDDLESLGYMALYFLHGSLPWQGLKASNRHEKYRLVYERKKTVKVAELCHGLPREFATYMSYIRELGDQGRPNYKYLRNLFDGLFRSEGFEYDNVFDWTIRELERLSHVNQQHLVPRRKAAKQKTPRNPAGRRDKQRMRRTRAKE